MATHQAHASVLRAASDTARSVRHSEVLGIPPPVLAQAKWYSQPSPSRLPHRTHIAKLVRAESSPTHLPAVAFAKCKSVVVRREKKFLPAHFVNPDLIRGTTHVGESIPGHAEPDRRSTPTHATVRM